MPGNEMIHIQEGYLGLNFSISKQQHVIFTLEPFALKLLHSEIHTMCLTFAFDDDPLTLI